jgi:MFS transporter, DHA2 family, multidrug resistance protein
VRCCCRPGAYLVRSLGTAFIQTFIRVREHLYSNLVGLHAVSGATSTDVRLQNYASAVLGRSIGDPEAHERGTSLRASAIRKQSYVLAYIDGFMILGLWLSQLCS